MPAMGNRLRDLRKARPNWTVADAAEAFGYSESGYLKLEVRKSLDMDIARRASEIYGVPIEAVVADDDAPFSLPAMPSPQPPSSFSPRPVRPPTGQTIPVYGQAVGGENGDFLFNGEAAAFLPAPTSLTGVVNAYAVYVAGESMEPRLFSGETAYVHPHRPVRPGDFVVVQVFTAEGQAPQGFIKQLVTRNDNRVRLRQFNPERTFDIPASRIISVHKIVSSDYL